MKYLRVFLTATVLCGQFFVQSATAQNTLVPTGSAYYAPSEVPDRIVLTPAESPATNQTVNWRTSARAPSAMAQVVAAADHPALHIDARTHDAQSLQLITENGLSLHHSVTFDDLEPDTLYAYRVSGADTWSEWFQFRTPKADFTPYDILYFGDAQNAVKSHFSRVIREANATLPRAALMIHAGDLVNSRDGVHDDEWGEWFDAGGWLHGMSNQLVAAGNHEYIEHDEDAPRTLSPHWPVQFSTPGNGPEGMQHSVYHVDYQGVRYIVLDSMAALQNRDNAQRQAQWLETALADNDAQWTIVVHHHPVFSVSQGRDNPLLRELWQPLYNKYGVDLVLQGHDHTYGRGSNLGEGTSGRPDNNGPVYVVSVAGPKMYLVSEDAESHMTRTAEDTQLFQVISFEADALDYTALTATGNLYDEFRITRDGKGTKTLLDKRPSSSDNRCGNQSPVREDRCRDGSEIPLR